MIQGHYNACVYKTPNVFASPMRTTQSITSLTWIFASKSPLTRQVFYLCISVMCELMPGGFFHLYKAPLSFFCKFSLIWGHINLEHLPPNQPILPSNLTFIFSFDFVRALLKNIFVIWGTFCQMFPYLACVFWPKIPLLRDTTDRLLRTEPHTLVSF